MYTLVTQPIPYQGSKRNLAKHILPYFPKDLRNLYEPFAGSAAITISSAYYQKAARYFINDKNAPLMELWNWIINSPEKLAEGYTLLWNQQQGRTKEFYAEVRERFNQSHDPCDFLYLLARCVKGSVRYNADGQFNQSPDNRRLGKNPGTMKNDLLTVSALLKGKTSTTAVDYQECTQAASPEDLIYLDPPYQGTCTGKDNRYYSGVKYEELMNYLDDLNKRNIAWILSYDGKTGEKTYGKDLPSTLHAHHIEVNAGRSSQATLNGGDAVTIESVYLSRRLLKNLNLSSREIERRTAQQTQLSFL